MSVATSSIPHRKPSTGRAGCSGSLHRKLVEGRAGNQRCKKKDRTQETLLALRSRTACWVVEAGGRGLQHVVPSARIAREGAPALSGEESSRLVGSRSAGTLWLGCVGLDALCSQPACTTTSSAGIYSLLKRKAEWLDGEYKKKAKGNVEKKNNATFI